MWEELQGNQRQKGGKSCRNATEEKAGIFAISGNQGKLEVQEKQGKPRKPGRYLRKVQMYMKAEPRSFLEWPTSIYNGRVAGCVLPTLSAWRNLVGAS
jgi:hypothetical protein